MRRLPAYALFIPVLFCVVSCAWRPRAYYPNAFERAEVLDKGKTEIGLQIPFFNFSVAHGFLSSGLEVRGFTGISNYTDLWGGGLSVGKALARSKYVSASVLAGGDYVFGISVNDPPFRAFRATGTFALGFNLPEDLLYRRVRIVLPVKVAEMFYDLDGRKGRQLRAVPGIGLCFDSKRWVIDMLFNLALPFEEDPNEVMTVPYFGTMISYRF